MSRVALILRPACLFLLLFGSGCVGYSEPALESEDWQRSLRESVSGTASGAAALTAEGARKAGAALGVAVTGVRQGFAAPDPKGYGPFPKHYARTIRRHLVHHENLPKDAKVAFGWPQKGWLNEGLLAGGAVEWQGYLVDVTIEVPSFFASQATKQEYVVRLDDGHVIEVLEREYAGSLQRADREGRSTATLPSHGRNR